MPPTDRPGDQPPRPTATGTRTEFGATLRKLREWCELTQKGLENAHPALSDATISDHERGVRLPRWEWVTAYVEACLQHRFPEATRPQLEAELAHWRAAWGHLNRHDTGQTQDIPAQHPTTPQARTADSRPAITDQIATSGQPPASAASGHQDAKSPRRAGARRSRRWLVGGGVAVVVAVAGSAIIATASGAFDNTPNPAPTTPAPLSGSAIPMRPVHASGNVENLRGVEGIDLDTNNRADQNAPGVDISFSATSNNLYAMSTRVSFTVLPDVVPAERSYCEHATGWTREISTIYELTEGRAICVRTDEGRYSMLTITKRATAATGTISFHYVTWA